MSLADLGPYRLSPDDASYEDALRESLVRDLYDRSMGSMAALIPVLFIMRAILGEAWHTMPAIRRVFVFLVMVLIVRLLFFFWIRRNPGQVIAQVQSWGFLVGAILLSSGYFVMNWLAWPYLGEGQLGLLIITHAGICAVALTSMGPSVWSYLAYMGIDVSSLLLLSIFKGGFHGLDHILTLQLTIFMIALTFLSIQNHRIQVDRTLTGLKLMDLSLRDSLTGLRNRRYLREFMGPESDQILRSWAPESVQKQSLAILMLDLDHFKQVNDTYGHGAGDAILRQMATLMTDTLRRHDFVIRWGGEEFVIVARGSDRGYALILAERLRERVEAHTFALPDGSPLKKTCSIGYSLFPFSTENPQNLHWEQVLSLADASLYLAKKAGRNRAIGALEGHRPWSPETLGVLSAMEGEIEMAAKAGTIKLVGSLTT